MLNGTHLDKTSIYNDILKDIKPLKEIRKEKLNDIINNDKEEEEPRSLFKKFMNKLF
jgi:nitrogenase subunit NifH